MTKKTIRMPKKLLAKWLKALRSGEYKQAKDTMYEPETCGFCCLGVLQHVASRGYVEVGDDGEYEGAPSLDWLSKKGIHFSDGSATPCCIPYLPTLCTTAALANDSGKSFPIIADAIEACAEGY